MLNTLLHFILSTVRNIRLRRCQGNQHDNASLVTRHRAAKRHAPPTAVRGGHTLPPPIECAWIDEADS